MNEGGKWERTLDRMVSRFTPNCLTKPGGLIDQAFWQLDGVENSRVDGRMKKDHRLFAVDDHPSEKKRIEHEQFATVATGLERRLKEKGPMTIESVKEWLN